MTQDPFSQPLDSVKANDLPDFYGFLLSQVTTDLSAQENVNSAHTFPLVSRLQGWKPINAARIVSQSETKKQGDCPLCLASEDTHALVWHAYGVEKKLDRAVRAAQDQGIVGVTPKMVSRHFPNHNYAQPAPAQLVENPDGSMRLKRVTEDEMLYMAEQLSEREKKILLAVARQRALKSQQIIDLFFTPETNNDDSARKSAYRTLHKLRYSHMLYQYRSRNKRSPDTIYFLGRHAVPFVEQHEGKLNGKECVTRISEITEFMIAHDTGASGMFVDLRKQLYNNRGDDNLVEVEGVKRDLHLPSDAWWSARSLSFSFANPFTGTEQRLSPDGFAALTFHDGRHRQSRLPFFLEWDTGTKPMEKVVEQLVNYVALSVSGAVGQRFPQMKITGYAPPVLMVTSNPRRAAELAKDTRAALAKYGQDQVPTILITDKNTLESAAYHPGAWRLVNAEDQIPNITLAEHLLRANQVLLEQGNLHPRLPVHIDPEGAKPKFKPSFPAKQPQTQTQPPA